MDVGGRPIVIGGACHLDAFVSERNGVNAPAPDVHRGDAGNDVADRASGGGLPLQEHHDPIVLSRGVVGAHGSRGECVPRGLRGGLGDVLGVVAASVAHQASAGEPLVGGLTGKSWVSVPVVADLAPGRRGNATRVSLEADGLHEPVVRRWGSAYDGESGVGDDCLDPHARAVHHHLVDGRWNGPVGCGEHHCAPEIAPSSHGEPVAVSVTPLDAPELVDEPALIVAGSRPRVEDGEARDVGRGHLSESVVAPWRDPLHSPGNRTPPRSGGPHQVEELVVEPSVGVLLHRDPDEPPPSGEADEDGGPAPRRSRGGDEDGSDQLHGNDRGARPPRLPGPADRPDRLGQLDAAGPPDTYGVGDRPLFVDDPALSDRSAGDRDHYGLHCPGAELRAEGLHEAPGSTQYQYHDAVVVARRVVPPAIITDVRPSSTRPFAASGRVVAVGSAPTSGSPGACGPRGAPEDRPLFDGAFKDSGRALEGRPGHEAFPAGRAGAWPSVVLHGVLNVLVPTGGMHPVAAREPDPSFPVARVLETDRAVGEVVRPLRLPPGSSRLLGPVARAVPGPRGCAQSLEPLGLKPAATALGVIAVAPMGIPIVVEFDAVGGIDYVLYVAVLGLEEVDSLSHFRRKLD